MPRAPTRSLPRQERQLLRRVVYLAQTGGGKWRRGAHRVWVRSAAAARGDSFGTKRLGRALRREPQKVARSSQHFY